MFSGGYRVTCGRVHHDDPAPGSGFDIHVINADTGPSDGFSGLSGADYRCGHFGLRPHDEGSVGRNNLNELRLFQASLHIDIEPTSESKRFYSTWRDGVGNQDFLVNHDSTS